MTWLPPEKYIWDFWFATAGDNIHVFYLQATQADCGYNTEARHNFSSVGHAVLSPWGWRAVEGNAFNPTADDAWDNLSIWTGSIIQHPTNKIFYMFYTARGKADAPRWTPREWQRPQQIGLAVSNDLQFWERTENAKRHPVIANPGPGQFDGVTWRDPYVIYENSKFQVFICARLNPEPVNQETVKQSTINLEGGGAVVYLESAGIEHWQSGEIKTLIVSDEFYQLEVPQVFWRRFENGKRLYLIFCTQERDCSRARRARMPGSECQTGTYYMCSRLLPFDYQGIPELEEPARLLASGLYSGKFLHPETQPYPPFFGFVWNNARGHFVGGLSDAILTQFNQDGSLKLLNEVTN
jgi:beta-fructofuranosidase